MEASAREQRLARKLTSKPATQWAHQNTRRGVGLSCGTHGSGQRLLRARGSRGDVSAAHG
jgi:hypothetical protein